MTEIPQEYRGWWRIIEMSQWVNDGIDILGPALLSLTGYGDRLRMHTLLAYVNCRPTKTGVSFTWEGSWEHDVWFGPRDVGQGWSPNEPPPHRARYQRAHFCGSPAPRPASKIA